MNACDRINRYIFNLRTLVALVICAFLLQASQMWGQAPVGTPLTLAESVTVTGTIRTYAGSNGPPLPVSGTSAITQGLDVPSAVVPDGAGGFYFASVPQHRVYRVTAAGMLFVIAGTGAPGFSGDGGEASSAQLAGPLGLAVDAAGNLFIADSSNGRIRKVTPGGLITTVVGNGSLGHSGDGGPAVSAGMGPSDVAVDAAGNLFIADLFNNRIRKVSVGGTITTIAGTDYDPDDNGFAGDGGPATSARLDLPFRLAVDVSGNVYIADYDNGRIRKVNTAGIISTVAGNGSYRYSGDGGPATSAGMGPVGIAVDAEGTLFIADTDNDRIRKVTANGVISTVAGTGVTGFSGDGGAATQAALSSPVYVALDTAGNIYIADSDNHRIRRVTAAGVISTVAGNGTAVLAENLTYGFSGDGGPATSARLAYPAGVAVDAAGNVFFVDSDNYRIRKVSTNGVITTVAGNGLPRATGDGGPATSAGMAPLGIAVDAANNIYIADTGNNRIRKVNAAGVITTVAGTSTRGFAGDGGPAISAQFDSVLGVAVDGAGNLYIADSGNHRIRKVTPDGIISTVAGTGTPGFSGDGGPATSARLTPFGVTVDAAGNLYIPCVDGGVVRKVTPAGIISTVAGTGVSGFSGDGGPATSARLEIAIGVTVDAAGNLYISDENRIRKVNAAGVISTIAGNGTGGFSGDDVPAASAFIYHPFGLAVDGAGNLYIGENATNRVRKITFAQQGGFEIVDRGGTTSVSAGTAPRLNVGYAAIRPGAGSATPAGLAIFGFRQNNILVSEAGVPASPAVRSGRIYAEVNGPVTTGLAIANPNNQPVTISFYFTNSNGDSGQGVTTIPANAQVAKFLDQPPFNATAPFSGTFTFSSSSPVAVIALRGFTNERGEFLITTLPVADLTTPATGSIVFPHFADGGGWTTQIVLVNPSDDVLTGTVQFLDQQGQSSSTHAYSISARSSQKLQMAGAGQAVTSGSVRVVPAGGTGAPSGLIVFSFRNGGITVAEAGVPAIATGNAFRLYAEASGSIQTGIAVANSSSDAVTVTVETSRLDGSSTGLTGTLTIPGNGQTAVFLNQIPGFGSLPTPFQGILRLSSSAPIAVTGLRGRYNERDDFLITTTPPINELTPRSTAPLYFPHIADSGGYTTQFILFSVQPGSSASGAIQFFSQAGGALNLTLR